VHKFWHNGKPMDVLSHSRYGLTCRVLTESRGGELLTWYREDFLAKTYPVQEKALESKEAAAVYGVKWQESLTRCVRVTSLLKTPQCLLLEDSTQSSQTLTRWGSMRNGVVSEQVPLVRHTSVKESGLSLPTPSGCRSGKNHVAGRLDEWGGSSNRWRGTEIGKTHTPAFEEWVMGWPVQWTELTASATGRFLRWRLQHGDY